MRSAPITLWTLLCMVCLKTVFSLNSNSPVRINGSPQMQSGMNIVADNAGLNFIFNIQKTTINSSAVSLSIMGSNETSFSEASVTYIFISGDYSGEFLIHKYDISTTIVLGISANIDVAFTFRSDIVYRAFHSIYAIDLDTPSSSILVAVVLNHQNLTHYQINFDGFNADYNSVNVASIFYDENLIFDEKRASRFQLVPFADSGAVNLTNSLLVDSTTIGGDGLLNGNIFVGLDYLQTLTDYDFELSICTRGDVCLSKSDQMSQIQGTIMYIYGYECQDELYWSEVTGGCQWCLQNCQTCLNGTQCEQCMTNYAPNNNNQQCLCQFEEVSGICENFTQLGLQGCSVAQYDDVTGDVICVECSSLEFLDLSAGVCVCMSGYQRDLNDGTCKEICGDGSIVGAEECDDGNVIQGDGCGAECALETGEFSCSTGSNGTTYCQSVEALSFEFMRIIKNDNNSGTFYVKSTNSDLPFDFQMSQFDSDSSEMIFFTIFQPSVTLKTQLLSINSDNNTFEILIPFNFTIETLEGTLYLNLSQTRYSSNGQISLHSQKLQGTNKALKYSENVEIFETISTSLMGINIVMLSYLFIGVFAPKFIGLQGVLTMQLIFVSQLLITDVSKWPVGFMYLEQMKYSMGYNEGLVPSMVEYAVSSSDDGDLIARKMNLLKMKKLLIQNYNISGFLLILATVFFLLTAFKRWRQNVKVMRNNEKVLHDEGELAAEKFKGKRLISSGGGKQSGNNNPQSQASKRKILRKEYTYSLKVNEIGYHVVSQISFWCLLQVLLALSAHLSIENSLLVFVIDSSSEQLQFWMLFSSVTVIVSLGIIFTVALNYFANILLDQLTIGHFQQRPHQQLYKRILFVYIFMQGYLICFLFPLEIGQTVPCSVLSLVLHLIYMVVIYKIEPYALSLDIHKYSLWVNSLIYLVFLLFVNVINFIGDQGDFIVMCLGFFIIGACGVLIVLTGFRLYYEYRYGEELQKKIQYQRKLQKEKKQLKQKQDAEMMAMLYEEEAKAKVHREARLRNENEFLYENQVREDEMNDLLAWLETREIWTFEMKEKYYFKHFESKPLNWLREHDPKKYEERLHVLSVKAVERKKKKQEKYEDPEYKELVKRLKAELKEKKKNGDIQT